MRVYDVLTESKKKTNQKVEEAPFDLVNKTKAALGSKSAKVEVEINKEVKSIYKDYVAVSKQDPKKQGMNVDSLSRFLAAKGFANSPQEVIDYIKQDVGLMKRLENEKRRNNQAKSLRRWANYAKEAISKAEKIQNQRLNSKENNGIEETRTA